MTTPLYAVVARAVFPVAGRAGVMPLYIDAALDDDAALVSHGRNSVRVRPGTTASLGSYFNAFPAAYWSTWTDVRTVRLSVQARGSGTIVVWKSDLTGHARPLARHSVDSSATIALEQDLDLAGGGCLWIDLEAGGESLELESAEWSVPVVEDWSAATTTVGIPTFNRPDDCVRQLEALASDPLLRDVVDRIIVVDQGTAEVSAHARFAQVHARLGDALTLVRQPNLGGAGGFTRALREAFAAGAASVFFLDDDAIAEPEAVFRAVRFAQFTRTPTIVGGGMIHIDDPAVLYTQSEQWDDTVSWTALTRPNAYDLDFARMPFRSTPVLHRAERSDFNGWWMCLIPRAVVEHIGLPVPLFLKGDDVEFGLRARDAGFATVAPPGIALWHLGWRGKSPTRTWEAYFLHRNRLIIALLHSPHRHARLLIPHSFLGDIKLLLTAPYAAVHLRAVAMSDAMAGPEGLPSWLGTRMPAVRELRESLGDRRASPVTMLRGLWRSAVFHTALWWHWPRLSREYRAALPVLTSDDMWASVLRA